MLATENPNPEPAPILIGDYNGNDIVDSADYTIWRDNLGMSAAALQNRDPFNTGLVKEADFTSWRNNYGNVVGGGSGAGINFSIIAYAPSQAIPEPSSLALMLAAAAGLALVRRKQ
jgi:hypothetical protein